MRGEAIVGMEASYRAWRKVRLRALIQHYGRDFWPGKRVLELGARDGKLGWALHRLGATVCFADARTERLAWLGERAQVWQWDLNVYCTQGGWDVILHLGVLYHLHNPEPSLRRSCQQARHLVLETQVTDLMERQVFLQAEEGGVDQSIDGIGCRPTPTWVERVLAEEGLRFERFDSSDLDSGVHCYSWSAQNAGAFRPGLRRWWWCAR